MKAMHKEVVDKSNLDSLMYGDSLISFEYVEGHSGEVGNEMVDKLAKEAVGKEYLEIETDEIDLKEYEISEEEEIVPRVVFFRGAEESKGEEVGDKEEEIEEEEGSESENRRIRMEERREELNDFAVQATKEGKCRVCGGKATVGINWKRSGHGHVYTQKHMNTKRRVW